MKDKNVDEALEYASKLAQEDAAQLPPTPTPKAKTAQKPVEKPKKDTKHIKESVKYAAIFGGLFALVCYWQHTGQMAMSAALPSMCVCAALGGYGVGKNRSDR